MTRRAALLLVCGVLAARTASAESIGVRSLEELVAPAHVVARVTIEQEFADRTLTSHTYYRRFAVARVTDPIKGVSRGQVIVLYHDTGWFCPNIILRRGDDFVLFARRLARGYEAIWWTTGTMSVREDRVVHDLFRWGEDYRKLRADVVRIIQANPSAAPYF